VPSIGDLQEPGNAGVWEDLTDAVLILSTVGINVGRQAMGGGSGSGVPRDETLSGVTGRLNDVCFSGFRN
jgi:hypothetical protein